MTHILDTDHISIIQAAATPERAAILANLARHDPADVVLGVVSFHEQTRGAHNYIARATPAGLPRAYAQLGRLLTDYQAFPVLPFDAAAAAALASLLAARVRVGTMDLRIAATALSRGLTVVTRNARDFDRVPGLAVEDWTR